MKATVLLSGGQDSATCLHWALLHFDEVDAVSFNYGQRHRQELDAAHAMASVAGVNWFLYDIPTLSDLADSALVNHDEDVSHVAAHNQLPASFTPGRNALFLTVAMAHAYKYQREGLINLVGGMCQTDYSGYPDCRASFIDAQTKSLSLAFDREVTLHTPLMWLTKADTVRLAMSLGDACWAALAMSVTCYLGQQPGCGTCPACGLRAKGFAEVGVPDPAVVTDSKQRYDAELRDWSA